MKKIFVVLVLAAFVTGGAFAQISMSAGGGAQFDMSFANGASAMSVGGFIFFDIEYAEVNVDFSYGLTGGLLQLGISALGKYPFELGVITISPLLGAEYKLVLKAMDASQLGILAGACLDYPLTYYLYLRGEVLFNFQMPPGFNFGAGFGYGPRIKIGVGYMF
ncbi:MAG: hypothetical protein FWC22_07610 [Treponema sp.]|nr:hypothetical protein [Treponema sp.]